MVQRNKGLKKTFVEFLSGFQQMSYTPAFETIFGGITTSFFTSYGLDRMIFVSN